MDHVGYFSPLSFPAALQVARYPADIMTGVVLHIGLHKTATRFLQRAVFRNLDPGRFVVNPEPLFSTFRQAMRHPGDVERAEVAKNAAREARNRFDDRTLVLSDPSISGDMYSSHFDYADNLACAYEVFPDANILFFVRKQSDWLQSAYRQALVKGPGMPIEQFLNFQDGEFRQRIARVVHGKRNVEAKTLRFLEIYRAYADRFGPERVYLFRQEDLHRRPEAVYRRIAEALGLEELPPLPARVSGNRAFSALAIHLFFAGVRRAPQAPSNPAVGEPSPGLRRWIVARWRHFRTTFIRHAFDKLVYRDWDLLARYGMREKLDAHYDEEYQLLTAVASSVLSEGPGTSARAAANGLTAESYNEPAQLDEGT